MRTLRNTLLCLGLLLLAGATFGSPAHATRARKHALNDSPFFFDETDVFRFPGVLVHHTNKLVIEAESNPLTGSASAIYGGRFAIGVFGNRPALFNDLGATASLYGIKNLTLPRRLVDLMAGMQLGRHQSIGIGLSFSTTLQGANNISGSTRNDRNSGFSTLSFEVQLGYSLRRRNTAIDLGVEVTFNNYKIVEADEIRAQGSALPSFAVYGRGFFRLNKSMELAVDLKVARRHYAISTPSNKSSAAYGYFLVEALVGPRIAIKIPTTFQVGDNRSFKDGQGDHYERARKRDSGDDFWGKKRAKSKSKKPEITKKTSFPIVAYFTGGILLGYQSLGGSNKLGPAALQQVNLEQAAGAVLFPGFQAALEASLWRYIVIRFGFTARFFFNNSSSRLPGLPDPQNSEEPGNKTAGTLQQTQQVYSWAAGIGFNWNGFRLDGSFEAPIFTQGPNFIGGKQPGLFAMVSLSYAWR